MNWSISHTAAFQCEPCIHTSGNFHPSMQLILSVDSNNWLLWCCTNWNMKSSPKSMQGFVCVKAIAHIFLAVYLKRELIEGWVNLVWERNERSGKWGLVQHPVVEQEYIWAILGDLHIHSSSIMAEHGNLGNHFPPRNLHTTDISAHFKYRYINYILLNSVSLYHLVVIAMQ